MEAPEYYVNFVPHAERIDLNKPVFEPLVIRPLTDEEMTNCQLAADDVTSQIIGYGKPDYYSNDEFKVEGGRLHDVLIETRILQGMMRDNWWKESRFGELGYMHFLRLIKALVPQIDITPSLADLAYLSIGAFGLDVKGIHSIGAQSMLKSYSSRLLSFGYQKIFGSQHYTITSTPTKEGAKDTAFGDIKEIFRMICYSHPHESEKIGDNGTWIWPEADVSQQENLYFQQDKGDKGGRMENRSLKRKIKGAKGAKDKAGNESTRVGVQEVDVDEINLVENIGLFLDNLSNMRGNPQFQIRTSQNPELENDSGGFLCEPKKWGSWGYSSYEEVRNADPVIWPTKEKDIVYRFDGHRCLNIIHGKTIYHYMFDERRRERLESVNGENSPVYQSQARAMFSGETSRNSLLSVSDLQSSKWDSDHFNILNIKGMSMGVDPAHSGIGDQAVISILAWGDCIIRNPDDTQSKQRVIIADFPLVYVKNRNNFKWDPQGIHKEGKHKNDWWDQFVEVGGDVNALTVGAPVKYEQQIAIEMARLQKRFGIPKKNIWFDFSMCEEMGVSVRSILGYEPVGVDARIEPRGHTLLATGQSTKDRARSVTQENILLLADTLKMKRLRVKKESGGRSNYGKAFRQLTNRGVNPNLKGNPPESKKEYMKHNGSNSPDEMDAVSLAIGAAYAGGFRAESDVKESIIKKTANLLPLRPKAKLWF